MASCTSTAPAQKPLPCPFSMSRKSRRLSRLQSSTSQTWIGFDIGQLSKQILSYLHTLNKTCTPTLETSHGKWESSNQGKFFNHLSTVSFFSAHLDFLIEAQMFDYYVYIFRREWFRENVTQKLQRFSIVIYLRNWSYMHNDDAFVQSQKGEPINKREPTWPPHHSFPHHQPSLCVCVCIQVWAHICSIYTYIERYRYIKRHSPNVGCFSAPLLFSIRWWWLVISLIWFNVVLLSIRRRRQNEGIMKLNSQYVSRDKIRHRYHVCWWWVKFVAYKKKLMSV